VFFLPRASLLILCFLCISSFVLSCQYHCKWLPGKTRLRNDLLCVEWDVKLYSLVCLLIHLFSSLIDWLTNSAPSDPITVGDGAHCRLPKDPSLLSAFDRPRISALQDLGVWHGFRATKDATSLKRLKWVSEQFLNGTSAQIGYAVPYH